MTRPPLDRLRDILQAAGLVQCYIAGIDAVKFERVEQPRDAALFELAVLGEAAGHLPAEIQALAPDIPWAQIKAMRHHIVHGYWQIDFRVLTDTVNLDLEPLKSAVHRLIAILEPSSP